MVTRTIKRTIYSLMGALGVILTLVALFLLTETVQKSDDFDRLQDIILAINIAGSVLLIALLIGNLSRLLRDYRQNVPGAKLKARLVGMFVGLTILPLLVVFYFSTQFINRGIDSWFNVQVEEGLENALALSRAAIEQQKRQSLYATTQVAKRLALVSDRQLVFELSLLRRESGASEMTLYGANNTILNYALPHDLPFHPFSSREFRRRPRRLGACGVGGSLRLRCRMKPKGQPLEAKGPTFEERNANP